jgi:hypothetical protein
MSANLKPITLTDQERAQVRGELFKEKRKNFMFMVEVVGESIDWHSSYVLDDFVSMGERLDSQLWKYLEETGMFEDAENALLSSKDINGKGWHTS